MLLSQLLAALPAISGRTPGDPDILSVEHDSRRVSAGALFVARPGQTVDGHDFIAEAVARGAAAVVVSHDWPGAGEGAPACPVIRVPDPQDALAWLCAAFHHFPARKMVMIGVTGTDGKTTTCSLVHSILAAAGLHAGLITTVSAVIGQQVLDTGLHTTTPDAPDVQRYLAAMAEAGMTHCVLEATSHGLAQGRVTACEFDIAAVTNITHEHLDYHGTPEAYRAAKASLFEALATAYRKPGVEKLAVLNADDWSLDYLRGRLSVPHVSYGLGPEASIRATRIEITPQGTRFSIEFEMHGAAPVVIEAETSLVGEYNVSNCLAAAAVALRGLGLPAEAVRAGIAALRSVPGRMERIDLGQDFTAIVDFAHTPNALRRALETARQMIAAPTLEGRTATRRRADPGRVIVVFGSAGLRDRAKRRWMGEIAADLADRAVITAEDPRTESLEAIMAESAEGAADRGGREGETFWRIADRGEAIAFAVRLARAGDVVIACGKAHEQSMCFGTDEYPWDDRIAMRAALAARLGLPGPPVPRLPTSAR